MTKRRFKHFGVMLVLMLLLSACGSNNSATPQSTTWDNAVWDEATWQ